MIEISENQINRVNLILGGLKNAPSRAFSGVINRALSTVRTQSGRQIRETYKIRYQDVAGSHTMKIKQAGGANLAGEIRFAGAVIPLIKFGVNPARPQRKPVSVSVLKETTGKRLVSAYVANLGRYGVGVFERRTRRRDSSQQLYGPSVAHMMENESVFDKIEDAAMKVIDERVEHEISRILNGHV